MSNLQNENVKEDLLDNVLEMTVDEFMTLLDDLNVEGVETVDSLVFEATELLFEQRSI
jgi:hypothetical protein